MWAAFQDSIDDSLCLTPPDECRPRGVAMLLFMILTRLRRAFLKRSLCHLDRPIGSGELSLNNLESITRRCVLNSSSTDFTFDPLKLLSLKQVDKWCD